MAREEKDIVYYYRIELCVFVVVVVENSRLTLFRRSMCCV